MITDKSRYGHDAVLDLNCGDSVQVLRTEPMTLTEQEQKIVQKYLGIALLEKSYIDANGHLMVVLSDGRTLDVGSARGLSGATPYLGENGNWFVEGVDTLQSARGLPGFTPYIGENEHWWIDGKDTGIPARGIPLTEKADNTRFLRNDGTWQKVTPENIGAAKQSVVADHTARIEALEQRTVTAPYYTDDSVAYIKEIPENALPFASVDMVGGMTRKCTNLVNIYAGANTTVSNGVVTQVNADTAINPYIKIQQIDSSGNVVVGESIGTIALGVAETTFELIEGVVQFCFGLNGFAVDTLVKMNVEGLPRGTYTYSCEFTNITQGSVSWRNNMLNAGTEPLPYEPYFDGLRSAPVEKIESVGANLFDINAAPADNGTANYMVDKRTGRLSGTFARANTPIRWKIKVPKNDLITFGFTCATDTACVFQVSSYYQSSFDEQVDARLDMSNGAHHATVDSGDFDELTVTIYSNHANESFDISGVMINYGATALPYTPYRRNTLPIPAAVQALDGYGWGVNADCYNYIGFEKKQFVKRVGCVDMGTLDWGYSDGDKRFFIIPSDMAEVNSELIMRAICAEYLPISYNEFYTDLTRDKTICRYINYLFVRNLSYTDAATFKAAMSGVMLYYELAEPVITDISDLLSDDNLIGVEGGGTVTMVNEYGYDVPSEITYARLTWQ